MVQRLTWVKLVDSSQAQWIRTFHLYGGFFRKKSPSGSFVKGSVRVIQTIADPYKGFSVRRLNKGYVAQAHLVRQAYNFKTIAGFSYKTPLNGGVLLKNDRSVLIKHVLGPCFSLVNNRRFRSLFKKTL